jgi:hypothetical protein
MLICVDESGSINNHNENQPYFVVALIHILGKGSLKRKYIKFVDQNRERLKELDVDGEMFEGDTFRELKGHYFDSDMKHKFLSFFKDSDSFEIYFIKYFNKNLTDKFCQNKERAFNYPLKKAFSFFIRGGFLPNEDCHINLDNRNLKTDSKMQLDEYLNTDLIGSIGYTGTFTVEYFNSKENRFVQIADVFSNIFYNSLFTDEYDVEIRQYRDMGKIRRVFEFPLYHDEKV